jgi:vitamin K-dependent gamma-carboxylase
MFNPHENIVTAPWSPWQKTPWLMPLLLELSDWRYKMDKIEKEMYNQSKEIQIAFMADFPGLTVENFLQEDLGNASVELLKGQVIVELVSSGKNHTLREGDRLQLPPGEFHNIHTISETPSCFMYIYINTTEHKLHEELEYLEKGGTSDSSNTDLLHTVRQEKYKIAMKANMTIWEKLNDFIKEKVKLAVRSATMTSIAVRSIATGQDFEVLFNATVGDEYSFGVPG